MSLVKRLRDWQSLTKSVTDEAADRLEELEKLLSVEITQRTEYEMKAQGWISVEDRLPNERQTVLMLGSHVTAWIGWYDAMGGGWIDPCDEDYVSGVTHWMPLPPEQDND